MITLQYNNKTTTIKIYSALSNASSKHSVLLLLFDSHHAPPVTDCTFYSDSVTDCTFYSDSVTDFLCVCEINILYVCFYGAVITARLQ